MRFLLLAALALAASTSASAQTAFLDLCLSQPSDFDTDVVCGCTADRALEAGLSPSMLDAVAVVLDSEDSVDPGDLSPDVLEAAEMVTGLVLDCALGVASEEPETSIAPVERQTFTVGGTPVPSAVAGALGQQSSRFIRECAVSPDMQGIPGVPAGPLCQCVAEQSLSQGISAETLDASLAYETPSQIAAAPLAIRDAANVTMQAAVQCARSIQAGERPPTTTASAGAARAQATLPADIHTGQGQPPMRAEQRGTGAPIRILE